MRNAYEIVLANKILRDFSRLCDELVALEKGLKLEIPHPKKPIEKASTTKLNIPTSGLPHCDETTF